MVDPVVDLLLTTLRLRGDIDVEALRRRWAALNPAGFAALVEYEGCALWLYQRLKDLRLFDAVPPALAQRLSTRARRLAARNLLVDAQRDDLVRILNELCVPHVLLKGAAQRLVADRYRYADARRTTDVDVLVPEDLARATRDGLRTAGFDAVAGNAQSYASHYHLPPLVNDRAVPVEIHTSTSPYVPAARAWERFNVSARVVLCKGGPTRVPSATDLLWHAVTHAPLPHAYAFRIRFLQDATVIAAAAAEVDWSEIAGRLASPELPNHALAQRWVGTAGQLVGHAAAETQLGPLPALDFSRALSWRLTVFRWLRVDGRGAVRPIWGPRPVSRSRRLLIDEGTRVELALPPSPPPRNATRLHRAGRRVVASAARVCYQGWRMLQRA
jgi:hypothetical protein